jgi:hypothetical protein
MGGSSYSYSSRSAKADFLGYATKSMNDTFEQNKLRKIHPEMDPKGVTLRESRDSEIHPNSVPIIISLDFTGSMGRIPHDLVKDGLPKIVSGIIQNGVPDPQIMFLGVGDHECDRAPFQISQFESGDEELDMWLTRSYIEGGGGGNSGESYSLAHYFASKYIQTDAWEKRGKKGFLFTIGDEPSLKSYPKRIFSEIFGDEQAQTYTDKELLALAQEKWHVYHIMPAKDSGGRNYWNDLLGQHNIWLDNVDQVAQTIKDIVVANSEKTEAKYEVDVEPTTETTTTEANEPKIML